MTQAVSAPGQVAVLVCDDTAAKRYVISSWLRRDGYTVLEAETGAQALDVAGRQHIDLAVLDVHLPDMNGLEVCATLKARPASASTPVVHISAVAVETEDRSAGLDGGADAYLVDPIQPQEMLSTVRSLLRSAGARRSAELLATRLERLSAASLRINVALTVTRLAVATAEGTARVLDRPAVVLLNDGTSAAVARAGTDGLTTTSTVGPEVVEELTGAAWEDVRTLPQDGVWAGLLGADGGPWAARTVTVRALPVGLIAVPGGPEDHPEVAPLLERLTETASVTLANLRVYAEEHRTALTLQRSLLPATLPLLPGFEIAARYRASSEQLEIGGDFFDAFATDEGSTVVVIGDVQGHSLEAAVVMAELRYSLRAYMLDGYPAGRALTRLNRLLLRNHVELTATVCVLVFDPERRTVEIANAGHLPPLLLRDGQGRFLDIHRPLLGVAVDNARTSVVDVCDGDRLVLVTDGLVERRGQPLGASLARLAREASRDADLPAEALCDQLMASWGASEDDICVLVVDLLAGAALAASGFSLGPATRPWRAFRG